MKIGFIGAGRAGCSIGKYLSVYGQELSGYYDTDRRAAEEAAEFTGARCYEMLREIVSESGILFLTTPDGIIASVWEQLLGFPLSGKIICHCSGALSSDSLSGAQDAQAACCSLHPMLPFSNRFSSYQQLEKAFFTIEGQERAVAVIAELFTSLGNTVCRIDGARKPLYHAAASILSNHVIAVLDAGYGLLEACGFTREEAVRAAAGLVQENINHVLADGCMGALTGPIERGDAQTVQKHLGCLPEEEKEMYLLLGRRLLGIAEAKNPDRDYSGMEALLRQKQDGKC